MSTWRPSFELLSWYSIFKYSQVNSFNDWVYRVSCWYQWPRLLAWINNRKPDKVWHYITYPFPKPLKFGVWEWICNFIPHFIMVVITYPGQWLPGDMLHDGTVNNYDIVIEWKTSLSLPSSVCLNQVYCSNKYMYCTPPTNRLRFVVAWWRHQMETFSVLLALCEGNSPVGGGFPSQRPVTRSFDSFFDLRLN